MVSMFPRAHSHQVVESLLNTATVLLSYARGRCRSTATRRAAAVLLLLVACALGCRGAALASGDDALQGALQDRYKALNAAMVLGDDRRLTTFVAPNFVGIAIDGERGGVKQTIGFGLLPVDPHSVFTTTLSSLRQLGDTVVVNQRLDIKTTEANCGGQEQRVEYVAYSIDTWIKANGTWVLQRSKTQRLEYYVNGEQIARDARPR